MPFNQKTNSCKASPAGLSNKLPSAKATFASPDAKQKQASNEQILRKSTQAFGLLKTLASDLGVDLLLTIGDKSSKACICLSTEPENFGLETLSARKDVKNYCLGDEQDLVAAVEAMLSQNHRVVLESASTQCSTTSQLDSKAQKDFGAVKAFVVEDSSAQMLPATPEPFSKASSLFQSASMLVDHENSEPIPDIDSIGPLRKSLTTVEQADNLDRLFTVSEQQNDAESECSCEGEEHAEYKESKYMAHAKQSHELFCTTELAAKRNDFAQRHLFRSGLDAPSEQHDSEEDLSFEEADLTDPVDSQNNFATENSLASLAGQAGDNLDSAAQADDSDPVDFMALACQDFEQAAKKERDEQQQVDTPPVSIDDAFKTPAVKRNSFVHKRFAKAASKFSDASCSSFDSYCQQSAVYSESETSKHSLDQKTAEVAPAIDIDSLMKPVPPLLKSKRSIRFEKQLLQYQDQVLGRKRNSPATSSEDLHDSSKRPCCKSANVSKFC